MSFLLEVFGNRNFLSIEYNGINELFYMNGKLENLIYASNLL